MDKRTLWDLCKIRIKEESIKWSKTKYINLHTQKKQLENDIEKIEQLMSTTNDKKYLEALRNDKELLCIKQNEIFSLEAEGAQVRSKSKWVEQGERNTKYFLNLEKKHQVNNTITCIKTDKGRTVHKSEQILQEGALFYRKLYKAKYISEKEIDDFITNIVMNNTLTKEEAEICEGYITENECTTIVKQMTKNKSPGFDGLTNEFYQCFWNDIKDLLIDSFNEAYDCGELSETHKQIIISLIFKKNDQKLFKNYRPISLSNVDYKILAFALAKRFQKVIGKIISPEQAAYIEKKIYWSKYSFSD